jgi:hypothetical protein
MRLRIGISCATITCAGAALATAASCVTSNNSPGPGGTDASFSEAGSPDTGSVQPIEDAGADTAIPDSAPATDAPVDAGCSPRSGFQPTAYVPATNSLDCIGSPIQGALATDCFNDAATYASCAGFADAGFDAGVDTNACLACLVSPEDSDAGYGAVVQGVVPVLNVAGCIQLGDPSDAGYTCAAAVQAAWACAEYACKSSCPVSDDPSRAAYVACTELAATGVCSAYTQLAQACVAAEVDGGSPTVAMYCFDGANDAGETLTLLDFFCGT